MGKRKAAAVHESWRTKGVPPLCLQLDRDRDGVEVTSAESEWPQQAPSSISALRSVFLDRTTVVSSKAKNKDSSPSHNLLKVSTQDEFQQYHTSADDADRSSKILLGSDSGPAVNMLRSGHLSQWNDSGDDDVCSSVSMYMDRRNSYHRPRPFTPGMDAVADLNQLKENPRARQLPSPVKNMNANESSLVSASGTNCWLYGSLSPDTHFMSDFISSRGHEYFCEIDEDYLTDRFNLTGINVDVQYYQYALDLVTDVFELDCDDDMREQIEKSARHLYGLVHARYITTTRGLAKMLEKYKKGDFGKCPRVMCSSHPLLPTGLSDNPHTQSVKLYCGKCEDLYNPKSSRHANIDGAYFGTSFQNILFQVYPTLVPEKTIRRYEPKVFGFKVHATAALERWQSARREEMLVRLRDIGFGPIFREDVESGGEEVMEDDDDGEGIDVLDE